MVLAACRLSRARSSTRCPLSRSWTETEMVCACAARISASACSRLLIADLQQVVPGVDPGRVPVRPLHLHRVPPHLVHPPRLHVGLHLGLAHHPAAAPLLDALGARTLRPQPPGRELRLPPVVPADEQVALVVEGQGGRLGLRLLRLDLVEQAHVLRSNSSTMRGRCSAPRPSSTRSPCPTICSPTIPSGSGIARGWRWSFLRARASCSISGAGRGTPPSSSPSGPWARTARSPCSAGRGGGSRGYRSSACKRPP